MFYPAHLNLQNRKCLVVGAGLVAARKVLSLLRSGGEVTLISPEAISEVETLMRRGQLQWHKREFQSGDTAGMFLVCAATDRPEINTQVFREAHEEQGIDLVNVVDVVSQCTFAAASVVTHGEFTISVSTSGKSPAMARRVREYLEAKFEALSLYEDRIDVGCTPSVRNQALPYPVYLLLENRRCVVVSCEEKMSDGLARRVDLLHHCGASIERINPATDNLDGLSDAFLLLIDDREWAYENPLLRTALAAALERIQIIEYLNTPARGTFSTPRVVRDGDLIISISANHPGSDGADQAREGVANVQTELAHQFENNGYGGFIDFLASLRPQVMNAISTQKRRQRYFDDLIDLVPGNAGQKCCFGFEKRDCSTECTFNLIRSGQIERARQYARQQIEVGMRR